MTKELMPAGSLSEKASAARLADKIRGVLAEARRKAEKAVGQISARVYWQVGKLIGRDILRHQNRAGYGDGLIPRLSKAAGVRERLLYDCLSFYKKYPILPSRAELTWTHYRQLLTIEEPAQRKVLGDSAAQTGWSVAELEKEIKKSKRKVFLRPQTAGTVPFKPRRGRLHTWIVRRPVQNSAVLELDLGFYTFKALSAQELARFQEGGIVEHSAGKELVKSDAVKNELYTYEAELDRVVDGDTLWMKILLGFDISVRQKLRLRGIDCPELPTAAGKRAKQFVEDFLSRGGPVTVTTTKPDKYDRYLSDLWIGADNLNLLLLKNHLARPKSAYKPADWRE